MNGRYFAHGNIRTIVSVFGYLFNKIMISRFSADGQSIDKLVHVPILYMPRSRVFKIEGMKDSKGREDIYRKYYSTFPRMGFEFTGLTYAPDRQLAKSLNVKSLKQHGKTPAPYTLSFNLVIVAREQFEALQIIEQIIPRFKPNLTVEMKHEAFDGLTRQLDVNLDSIEFEDDWSELDKERAVVYRLSFTVETDLYGFVKNADIELAKFVECGGKVDVPIDENWPSTDDPYDDESYLIEKVIVDLHQIEVWPKIFPVDERTTITAVFDQVDRDVLVGYRTETEEHPENQIPVDYSTSDS